METEDYSLHLEWASIFDSLFMGAKQTSELHYAFTLMRVRGIEAKGWDPLRETEQLIEDMLGLIEHSTHNYTRIRLALVTYCHLVEVSAIYKVLANLVTIKNGGRYDVEPFLKLYRGRDPMMKKGGQSKVTPPSSSAMVGELRRISSKAGENRLVEILDSMFNADVRNAFFHSDYILAHDEFRSADGTVVRIKLDALNDQIHRGIVFYQAFMHTYAAHGRSYGDNKTIKDFLANGDTMPTEITLLADPERGLYGFRGRSLS
jgi:hypothetical protein